MTGPARYEDRIIAPLRDRTSTSDMEEGTATFARITTAAGVRPGERPLVVLVAAAFAVLEAGRGIGEVGANTLVVGRLGANL